MVILTFPCAIHRGRIEKILPRRGAILICQLGCGKWSRILQRRHRCIDPGMELSDGNIDQHGIIEDFGAGTCK